jgi:hypothetical protein
MVSQHFNEWYKKKINKDLMARYRTLLINSGENMDVDTEQDDWSYGVYSQLISDGTPNNMIAEEIRMECRHIEWLMRQRRAEVLKKFKIK